MKKAHELHKLHEKKFKKFVLIRVIRGPLFFHRFRVRLDDKKKGTGQALSPIFLDTG
jgi:hypothetical protein